MQHTTHAREQAAILLLIPRVTHGLYPLAVMAGALDSAQAAAISALDGIWGLVENSSCTHSCSDSAATILFLLSSLTAVQHRDVSLLYAG